MNKYLKIIYCVAICLAVGYLSSNVTQSSINTWYPEIKKPSFNPPNWVFAPVWTMLFIMMGIAAGMVWNKLETNQELVKKGLLFFTVQLLLNALWSYLFFGLKSSFGFPSKSKSKEKLLVSDFLTTSNFVIVLQLFNVKLIEGFAGI